MKYDKLNFFIISTILSSKNISSWEIAKKYNWEDKPEQDHNSFYTRKVNLIERRLDEMRIEHGGFAIKENGKYSIVSELVSLKKVFLPDKTKVDLIFVKDNNGCWEIFFKL